MEVIKVNTIVRYTKYIAFGSFQSYMLRFRFFLACKSWWIINLESTYDGKCNSREPLPKFILSAHTPVHTVPGEVQQCSVR